MEKKIVPFEIAKKLADKGFDKPTLLVYNDNGIIPELLPDVYTTFTTSKNAFYPAPNIYEVMDWLREEKNLYIRPSVYWIGWCFDITDINKNDKFIYSSECEYQKFEQAAIAGINYVINNLI